MRNLRNPAITAGDTHTQIAQIVSFLRQLVTELNLEGNGDAEKVSAKGWSCIKRGGVYEAFGEFTVTATQSASKSGDMYVSERFAIPLPFDSTGAVVAGNVVGAVFLPELATKTHTAFKIATSSTIASGAKFSVRLHVSAMI